MHWEWEGNSSLKENGRDGGQVKAGTCVSGGDEEREMDQAAGRSWRHCSEIPGVKT